MSIATTSVKSELVLYLTREATILNKRYDVVKWIGTNTTLTSSDLANQPNLSLVTNELYILNNVGGNNIVVRMINVDMTAIQGQIDDINGIVSEHSTSINSLNTTTSNHTTSISTLNTNVTSLQTQLSNINTELTQLESSISLKENIVPVRTIVLDSTNYNSVTGDIVITTPSTHIYDIEVEIAPNQFKSFSFPYTITGNTLTIKTQSGLLLGGMTIRVRCLEYIEDTEDLLGWQNIDWADFPNKKIYILDSNTGHANIMKTTMINTANSLGLGGDITSKIVIIPLGINNVPNDAIVALQSTTGAINYQQQAIDYLKPKNCLFFMPMGSNSNVEITGFTGFPDAMVLSGSTANGTTNSTAYGVGLEFIEYDEAISGDPTEESSYSNARLAAKYYVLLEFLYGLYMVGDPMPVITPNNVRLKMREHTNATGYNIQRGYGVFDDIENAASELYGN